jgi:hypothetical protein
MVAIAAAAAVAAIATTASTVIASNAAADAAELQAGAALTAAQAELQGQREAIEAQREFFNITRDDLAPYRRAGARALTQLGARTEGGREFNRPYTLADFQADPGYQFRLEEGQRALDRSAASRGGLLSGRAVREGIRYGEGVASDEYDRAFNRLQADRQNRFNRLAAVAGIGQASTAQSAQLAQQTGANLSDLALQGGQIRASGYANRANALAAGQVAQANIINSGVSNLSNLASSYALYAAR